ncbi:MAG: hypothetical protein KGJ57_07255 [Sphingomonadales bacterium]|nr:hypothetical protein [Sphingomonadales bacterium]MDE2169210.1 hypothetical protein [Sphingomonadales bacterium]
MRKSIVFASFLLVACGPSSCHLFGPSAAEMAQQKAQERADANRRAIAACETANTQASKINADDLAQQQTIIKTTLDKVSEGGSDPQTTRALDWSIEIAAIDASGWRWTETSQFTAQHPGFLGSTSTQQSLSTITYTLNPADLQETLTVIPHDDGTAAVRFYCKSTGCIHLVGATQQDKSSNLPFAGSDSHAGTVSQNANSHDWLLSTRTRAEGLKATVEKLLQREAWKAPACVNADGSPSEAAPLVQPAAASSAP